MKYKLNKAIDILKMKIYLFLNKPERQLYTYSQCNSKIYKI
jgi:hypothetical protein